MNFDDKCQLLIIGNSIVGKTSILTKYTTKNYTENYLATVGLDFFTKDETIDNKIIRIKIWDTAGQERYKAITKCFFQRAQGIIIVFDVTNKRSFDGLKMWIDSINSQSKLTEDLENMPIIIIGNKIDLPKRVIDKETALNFAKEQNLDYFETSAKTGEGIDNAMRDLVKKVMAYIGKKNGRDNNNFKHISKHCYSKKSVN